MDLIDRQAVIDAVAQWFDFVSNIKETDGTVTIFERLREIPSEQPERKKGRWLDSEGKEKYVGYYAECSACGGWSEYITDFCPNCGAIMKDGEKR